jgi:hypothetical protein
MRVVTKWHVLKFRRCAISTSENRFVNWREWRFIGMAWSEYGEQIKVSREEKILHVHANV